MTRPEDSDPILVEVVRNGFVESVHRGRVAVTGPDGALVGSVGAEFAPMYPRSSSKPLQAVGMLRAGLKLEGEQLALVCASHSGESFHLDGVRAILAGAGLDESALQTPPDWPLDDAAREAAIRAGEQKKPLFMNCSGKHAGMLATCVANGWPLDTYLDPRHPLQVAIADAVADLAGEKIAAVGVDGCGAPVLAVSLTGLARAFQRLVEAAPGSDERRVADEMRAHPELVAGTGADDTVLMAAVPGLLAKGGAEGVVAVGVPGRGAVAIKIEDGAMRARTPVLLDELRRLGVEVPVLEELVLGGGEPVGEVRPVR
jgi:L-asparaginase II